MSTFPTRYHHGNLREALVDEAVLVAREHGPDGLALRDLARRVGVSHNAAYRHFADREALVEEVAARGLVGLVAAMDARLDTVSCDDPVERARRRLVETGRGYVDFAIAEPGLFRVLFSAYPGGSVEPDDAETVERDPFAMLNSALDDLVTAGFLHPTAREGAEHLCWAVVHGFAVLHTEGPLRDVPQPERDVTLQGVLLAVDRGYGATTGREWPPLALDAVVNDR